jgi:hypothetical protein
MKKFFFYVAALCLPFFNTAQEVVGFESIQFPTDQNYWNGSDESGGFSIHGASFNNSYNPDWMSWSGFAVSSETDTITAGFENQFSCFAGSGAANSEKFGIWYSNGEITFDIATQPMSIALTNTTYAALSMRDGDDYGKVFGSIYNAEGDVDGTDGKDWFKLTIIGVDANDEVTAEVDFYLADFRSDDSLEHYILEQWETVDLSELGTVYKILFEMNSTDIGGFGMNTPGYFALDNLTFYQSGVGIQNETLPDYSLYPNPAQDFLKIHQTDNQEFTIRISNTNGAVVQEKSAAYEHTVDVSDLPNGVYFVQMMSVSYTKTARVIVAH